MTNGRNTSFLGGYEPTRNGGGKPATIMDLTNFRMGSLESIKGMKLQPATRGYVNIYIYIIIYIYIYTHGY